MKTKNVRIRPVRGTTLANKAYIGPSGSLSIDTELNQIRIHDGITPGGHVVNTGGTDAATTVNLLKTYPSLGQFPAVGEHGSLYVAIDTAVAYRWSDGGSYIEVTPKPHTTDELQEGDKNLYHTPERVVASLKGNDGILVEKDGTIKARIASVDSVKEGKEMGEFITPKVFIELMKAAGCTQDANGNLVFPTAPVKDETPAPSQPEVKDDTVGADGVSRLDTTTNKGTLARMAAKLNTAFTVDKTSGGVTLNRWKYPNDGSANLYTYGKAIINEDAPYAIINMDNMEFAVGVFDYPGAEAKSYPTKLMTLNNTSNKVTMLTRNSSNSVSQLSFPTVFGYVDQPETMVPADVAKKYKATLTVVGKDGGPGVVFTSIAGAGGGPLGMRRSINGKTVGSDFSAKYVKGAGYPVERILTLELGLTDAQTAFPSNEIYSTNTGSSYVQVLGEFVVTMSLTNTETNETQTASFPLSVTRTDG